MNTKIVFFAHPDTWKNRLVQFFTKCPFQHVGFLQWNNMILYDMSWMRRKILWIDLMASPDYDHDHMIFAVVDSPVEIPDSYFENKILNENTHYGWMDYMYFGARWFLHLFGMTAPNKGGLICSEMVHVDICAQPTSTWTCKHKEVHSPCDLWRDLIQQGARVQWMFGSKVTGAEKDKYVDMLPKRAGGTQ